MKNGQVLLQKYCHLFLSLLSLFSAVSRVAPLSLLFNLQLRKVAAE